MLQSLLILGGPLKRFAVLAAAALVLSGCAAQTPPPVSDKVQDFYEANKTLKPVAAASSPAPKAPAVPVTLRTAFKGKTEMPSAADTGQPFGTVETGKNESVLSAAEGLLRHGAATDNNAASYLEADLGKPVEKIGAEAVFFHPGGGQIALVAWEDSIAAARNKDNPDRVPNGGIHFVASPTGWHLGVYDTNKGERIVAQGPITVHSDGVTPNKFEITRKGSMVWITLPDGSTSTATDPKIGQWSGRWATWELYENTPGLVPAAFSSVWAG